jgi:uncharacterized protein (DUF1499 family)
MGSLVTAFLLLLLLIPALLSVFSRFRPPDAGFREGRLQDCPLTSNCVSSEEKDRPSYAEPLRFQSSPESAWKKTRQAVLDMGGRIAVEDAAYMHATFTSSFFRFVDDLQLRLDRKKREINFRAASRVGYSDLGVNRKRVEELRRRVNDS